MLSVLALALGALGAPSAFASHDVTPARVAGPTRVGTAAEVADLAFPAGTDGALLATSAAFPDALAAAPLAGTRDAPVLLTAPDQVPDRTWQALDDLGVQTVTILGGEQAVPSDAEQSLRDRGYQVDRIAGPQRWDTAAAIARAVQDDNGGAANFPGDVRAAFVANGNRFPDALAAGAPASAGSSPIPIVLVTQDDVPQATAQALSDLNIETAFVVGGQAAVSDAVVNDLEQQGLNVDRIAGPTRTATATAVADFARSYLSFDASLDVLSRGDGWADALAAGPYAGMQRAPVLLTTDPDTLGRPTADWLSARCSDVDTIRAVGGDQAVSPGALNDAEQAAENCHSAPSDDAAQDYVVAPQQPRTVAPGESVEFSVGTRYDDQPFQGPVDVDLFACDAADNVVGGGTPTFHDADGDGQADAIRSTDSGAAAITAVDGSSAGTPTTGVSNVSVGDDGQVSVTVSSEAADCALVVFFHDTTGDNQLAVDDQGNAREPFGIGKVTWTS